MGGIVRKLAFGLAVVTLGPIMVVAGAIAGVAIVSQVLSGWFGIGDTFDFSAISLLDWFAAGPGATAGSGVRYIAFMIGFIIAAGCFFTLKFLWEYAKSQS